MLYTSTAKTYAVTSMFVAAIAFFLSFHFVQPAHAMPVPQNDTPKGATAKNMPPQIIDDVASSTPECPALTRGLARGTQHSDVLALQKFFVTYYAQNEEEIATGYFGPRTQALVERFQKEKGLPVVGVVGPRTRAALMTVCGEGDPSKPHVTITTPKGSMEFTVGESIPVSWTTRNVASGTGMYLQLATVNGDETEIVQSVLVPFASGSTTIDTGASCNGNFSDAIFGACENLKEILKDGKKPFKIYATLYTPKDYCFGFCMPTTTPLTIVAKGQSSAFFLEYEDAGAFTATSTSGKAPLTTTFTIARAGMFTLDFGDGSDKEAFSIDPIVCITTPCNPTHEVKHTYTKPGQYYATLTRTVKNDCKPTKDTVCALWYSKEETVGTITIDVIDPKKK